VDKWKNDELNYTQNNLKKYIYVYDETLFDINLVEKKIDVNKIESALM
jgi:hypothetical protein